MFYNPESDVFIFLRCFYIPERDDVFIFLREIMSLHIPDRDDVLIFLNEMFNCS